MREPIPILLPGRELDALVAENVMGLGFFHAKDVSGEVSELRVYACGVDRPMVERRVGEAVMTSEPLDFPDLPHYSTDIADAWEVLEHIDRATQVQWNPKRDNHYSVVIGVYDPPGGYAQGETLPYAICLAALRARGWW